MVSLYVILDGIKSYIDRCENCPAGREGSCRWLGRFSTPEGGSVWEGLSYEERARKMHRKVGYPPCNQRTFHQVRLELLKTMGEVRCKGLMPKTVTDIRNFLLRVAQTAQGLEDLPEQMRLAFGDVVLYALESALGALDYYFLDTLHKDYLELFLLYWPKYDRKRALREFAYDRAYIEECIGTAKKVHIGNAEIEAHVAGGTGMGVSVVSATGALAGLVPELVSERAMTVWTAALHNGWVDSDYRWKLGKQEKAMFVGRFSQFLFSDKRAHWQPFKQWDSQCNYSKDFNTTKGLVMVGEANEDVTAISAYFDTIDKAHSLSDWGSSRA